MIELKDCSKEYSGSLALNSITLSFEQNGLVLLLGSNAAGKSTLLKAMAGLVVPSQGSVSSLSPVAYFAHEGGLYPQLTAEENFQLFKNLGLIDSELLSQLISELELPGLFSKLVSQLSQGQRARLNLLRVFSSPSGWPILLDEPAANLDIKWSNKLSEIIKRSAKDRLLVLITHDPSKYYDQASRFLFLNSGVLIFDQLKNNSSLQQIQELYMGQLK